MSTGFDAMTRMPAKPSALSLPTMSRTISMFFDSRSSRETSGPLVASPAVTTTTELLAASA